MNALTHEATVAVGLGDSLTRSLQACAFRGAAYLPFALHALAAAAATAPVLLASGPAAPLAYALVRPPGHHAQPTLTDGYCFVNNVGVAIQAARTRDLRRAVVIDWDVHHGNGTQEGFYADPDDFDRQLAVLEQYVLDHPTDRDARLVLSLNYLFGNRPLETVKLLESAASETVRAEPAGTLILEAARLRLEPKPN